ncbi:hypothetical protein L3Q82_006279 [Scortum barcoo]|uniref:Uncharacterized protein n=1 Tax=Scortum barcoo TaxID=214431 RepID=A0ACB8X2A4_9TELE|nr:hypothetical protein L3Q82_006279 [Scortum barcoo]
MYKLHHTNKAILICLSSTSLLVSSPVGWDGVTGLPGIPKQSMGSSPNPAGPAPEPPSIPVPEEPMQAFIRGTQPPAPSGFRPPSVSSFSGCPFRPSLILGRRRVLLMSRRQSGLASPRNLLERPRNALAVDSQILVLVPLDAPFLLPLSCQRLKNRLFIKREKPSQVSFLRFILKEGQGRVQVDPEKVRAVVERPTQTNQKLQQRFLTFANFYRRFVRNYSQEAAPLTVLSSHLPSVQHHLQHCKVVWLRTQAALEATAQKNRRSADKHQSPALQYSQSASLMFLTLHVEETCEESDQPTSALGVCWQM